MPCERDPGIDDRCCDSGRVHAIAAHTRRAGRAMNQPDSTSVVVAPARYVLLPLAYTITGYTVKAMERKIERGDWREGREWRHAPDGRVLIDLQGYQRWVEGL